MEPLEVRQDLSQMHDLAFWNLFPMVESLAQAKYKGKSMVLPEFDTPCFVDSYGKPYHLWMEEELGVREKKVKKGTAGEEGGEAVLGIENK